MQRIHAAFALAALLALAGGLRADDTVVLTDGTVITGQVMQETQSSVVIQDDGVQRTIDRSLVAKVEFDTSSNSGASPDASQAPDSSSAEPGDTVPPQQGGDQYGQQEGPGPDDGQGPPPDETGESAPPAGDVTPAPPSEDQQDYADGVAGYYGVPEDEVWGYEEEGVPYEDLPVVFYVARRAQVAPGLVVSLRMSGMSWADICMHFGLGPGIFYWHSLFVYDWGGPYGPIYLGFHRYPHRYWTWAYLPWTDAEIVNCVNLRFETGWWHLSPRVIVRWRGLGHPFFWAGYGYRRAAFHRPGLAARRGWAHAQRGGAARYRAGVRRGYAGRGRSGAGRRSGADRQHQGGGGQGGGGQGGGWNH